MTAHQMARKLLEGPDLRLAIENDGEYLSAPRDPVVIRIGANREFEFVVIDGNGESYGSYTRPATNE